MKYGMIIHDESLHAVQFKLAGHLGVKTSDIKFVMSNGVSKVLVNGVVRHGYRPAKQRDGTYAVFRFMTPDERAADLKAAAAERVKP